MPGVNCFELIGTARAKKEFASRYFSWNKYPQRFGVSPGIKGRYKNAVRLFILNFDTFIEIGLNFASDKVAKSFKFNFSWVSIFFNFATEPENTHCFTKDIFSFGNAISKVLCGFNFHMISFRDT